MKTLLTTLATALVGLVALPEKAEARNCGTSHSHTYRSGHASCGCPTYTRRVIIGYDCYHRPIYRYYSVPVVHRCKSHHNSPYYHRRHRHHKYHHHYDRHRGHRSHYNHRRHKSISFHTKFGHIRICR